MAYLVGGYILSEDQVLEWCRDHNIDDPPPIRTTSVVKRWLRGQELNTRLLAVSLNKDDLWYIFVTASRVDIHATVTDFEAFEGDDHARSLKVQLELDDEVNYSTVANPYGEKVV
jgi:hypothetical protein